MITYFVIATTTFGGRPLTDLVYATDTARSSAFGRSYLALAALIALAGALYPVMIRDEERSRAATGLVALGVPRRGGRSRHRRSSRTERDPGLCGGAGRIGTSALLRPGPAASDLTIVAATVPPAQRRATLGVRDAERSHRTQMCFCCAWFANGADDPICSGQ